MKRVQKPMMLAYIIFLGVCIVYHLVASICNLEFFSWNRIILAATIASYFFSLSSLDKMIIKQEKSNAETFCEELVVLKRIYAKEKKLAEGKKDEPEMLRQIENAIEEDKKKIEDGHKTLIKSEKAAFREDVLGFLAFFCIISFEGIYKFFTPFQDLCTLGALLMMITMEYIESTKLLYYEELKKKALESTKELLALLEEKTNG